MKHFEHFLVSQERVMPHWRRRVNDSLLSIGGVALVTGLIAVPHLYPKISTIPFVYLLLILVLASTRGLYAAILASLLAELAFDFFILPPLYTFVNVKLEDLLTLAIFLVVAIMISQLAWTLRWRIQEVQSHERELRLLYEQAQELAVLQERQRLARELHDSVSQALYGISLGVHTAREALESSEPKQAMDATEYVLTLAEAGLAEMRALIFALRPESLETEGLVGALTKQVDVLRTRHKLTVEADLGDEPNLSIEEKESLYRIVQEALHNIVKHAHASVVMLRLKRLENEITLEVCDNGRGFNPADSFPGHLGLRSMQERVAKVGGTVAIESASGQGTRISIRIFKRKL